jgi:hypothetical protein
MSKLGCRCHNTISDTSDLLPYKAAVISDVATNLFLDEIIKEALSFKDASEKKLIENWIQERVIGRTYWTTNVEDFFEDRIFGIFIKYFKDMYECEVCGRILIENIKSGTFKVFKPESGNYEGILKPHDYIDDI